jgi:hypothetical protein
MAGLGLFDPEVCRRVLTEYNYNFDHIQGIKQAHLEEILKYKNQIFTPTDLNNFLKNSVKIKDGNFELKKHD